MPDADADAPKKSRFAQHRDLLAALASGTVAALALATSTYNVYLQRQQVRAEVWPSLRVGGTFGTNGEKFSIHVVNRGVGPARVERVRVLVDGRPAETWLDVELKLLRVSGLSEAYDLASIERATVSPGADATIFSVAKHGPQLVSERRRLTIAICYCSTLDECWEVTTKDVFDLATTAPVADCVADEKPFRATTPEFIDQMAKSAALDAEDDAGDGSSPAAR